MCHPEPAGGARSARCSRAEHARRRRTAKDLKTPRTWHVLSLFKLLAPRNVGRREVFRTSAKPPEERCRVPLIALGQPPVLKTTRVILSRRGTVEGSQNARI